MKGARTTKVATEEEETEAVGENDPEGGEETRADEAGDEEVAGEQERTALDDVEGEAGATQARPPGQSQNPYPSDYDEGEENFVIENYKSTTENSAELVKQI